jgi:hypothetical protein
MNKERRKHLRLDLIQEICGWSIVGSPKKMPNRINNISIEGIFIESESTPSGTIEISLTLPGDLGHLDITGNIIWRRWATLKKGNKPLGFAVKLNHTPSTRTIMEAFCTFLRNKQIVTVSKRIIDEFFGSPKDSI